MTTSDPQQTASGIEALIARLRSEGVDEGAEEARRLVAEAERRARDILNAAQTDATNMRETARKDATQLQRTGEEALRKAMRDTVLEMKEALSTRFASEVHGTVKTLSTDEDLIKRMIVAVAGRAREEAGMDASPEMEIILPRSVVGLDELRKNPEELSEGSLSHFVATQAASFLRDGVTFSRADDEADGIHIVLKDDGLSVDLSDAAVADVILRHLQPRFRALLEGVVS